MPSQPALFYFSCPGGSFGSLLLMCATTVMFLFWGSVYFLWVGGVIIFMKSIILLTAAMSLIANIAEKDWIIILAE
jgi:hypothetical protein